MTQKMNQTFSNDFIAQLTDVLNKRYRVHLDHETIAIEGRLNKDIIEVTLVLSRNDDRSRYTIEGAIDLSENKALTTSTAARDALLDLIDEYLTEYFESDREINLHLDWKIYETENASVHLRGQITNPELDRIADQLLDQDK